MGMAAFLTYLLVEAATPKTVETETVYYVVERVQPSREVTGVEVETGEIVTGELLFEKDGTYFVRTVEDVKKCKRVFSVKFKKLKQ